MAPKTTQDRPKTGPRSSWIGFFRLDFSLRFLIVLGSILVSFWPPKWSPGGTPELGESALGGSKTVPRSSWFGPFFVLSFGIAFLVVLGSSWGRFWALCGSVWCFFGISTHRFNPSTHQIVDSTHQLINPPIQLIKPSSHRFNPSTHRFNSSTHQPMALRHFLTRPGGLRAARLNPPPPEGSERV